MDSIGNVYKTCQSCVGDLVGELEVGDVSMVIVLCMFHDQAGGACWNKEND